MTRYNPVPGLALITKLAREVAIDAIEGIGASYGIAAETKAKAIEAVRRLDGPVIPTTHYLITPDRCTECQTKSDVIDSRHRGNKTSPHLYRRRRCRKCNARWSTYEIRQSDMEVLGVRFRKSNRKPR